MEGRAVIRGGSLCWDLQDLVVSQSGGKEGGELWLRGAHLQDVMEGEDGTPVCRGLFLEGHWGGGHGQSNLV